MRLTSPLWPNARHCARLGWQRAEKRGEDFYRIAVAETLGMFWFVNLSEVTKGLPDDQEQRNGPAG